MIADERVKRRGPRAVSKFHLCVRSVEALTYIVPWRYGLRGLHMYHVLWYGMYYEPSSYRCSQAYCYSAEGHRRPRR